MEKKYQVLATTGMDIVVCSCNRDDCLVMEMQARQRQLFAYIDVLETLSGVRINMIVIKAATVLQRFIRRYLMKRRSAATKLQARVRGNILREDKMIFDQAVEVFNRACRAHIKRNEFKTGA